MSDNTIVMQCSPTLAGIKPANLFTVRTKDKELIKKEIRCFNKRLRKKGIIIIPVKYTSDFTLVYVYRPVLLSRKLSNPDATKILKSIGYSCISTNRCLVQLVKRLNENKSFPHEIGLFLGYPPSDVRSFMKNSCEGVKCVGCWKVYDNADEAKKTFETYKNCTDIYLNKLKTGVSLEQLAV